jgi:hypothetical protein
MGMATTKAADRIYDSKSKFKLAREYWSTESATSALRRRRAKKKDL